MTIAILGAGIQGCLSALALAESGQNVLLFDKESSPMRKASRWNEGKIHLGFVFANDPSLQTARKMVEGAFQFQPIIERLCSIKLEAKQFSTPFFYARHRESLLGKAELNKHYKKVEALIKDEYSKPDRAYFEYEGGDVFTCLSQNELEKHFDSELITDAWQVVERSIDPSYLSKVISEAVSNHPLIELICNTEITSLSREPSERYKITFKEGSSEIFTTVVNTLWESRLKFDQMLGIIPERDFLHRYKFATHIEKHSHSSLPSSTLVLGPFGDVVQFENGSLYLSWYPAGCTRRSNSLIPPKWEQEMQPDERREIFEKSLKQLSIIFPEIESEKITFEKAQVEGGFIFAWGKNDIDDMESEIHQRYNVGIESKDNYHSIDTGKYTTAPMFAEELLKRI